MPTTNQPVTPIRDGANPNVQGDTGAMDDAAEDIAPHMVRAQGDRLIPAVYTRGLYGAPRE